MPAEFWIYVALADISAFAAFGYDKARAMAGKRRVRERDLILLALIGGGPGAVAGRALFRHKIRRRGFGALMYVVALAQLMLCVAALANA